MLYHLIYYNRRQIWSSLIYACLESKTVIYETFIFLQVSLFALNFAEDFLLALENALGRGHYGAASSTGFS